MTACIAFPEHSPEDLETWFPDVRPKPEEGTFELGLVLAGAVSAGAYTAGVLDFLYEALDTWYLARARGEADVPSHDVVLRMITGASAGGMNGAISAAALRHGFPHPQGPGKPADRGDFRADNPFWRVWVREIDIRPLLDPTDLAAGIRSLLNCTRLLEIVRGVIDRPGAPVEDPRMRGWIANPLTVLLTVTNLRGVPYQIVFSGEDRLRHEMSLHRDHVAFAVPGLGGRPPSPPVPAPDLVALPERASFRDPVWREFGMTALATGAFPLFLEARKLRRVPDHYLYRHLTRHDGRVIYDSPAWPEDGPPSPYEYLCVDGGAMNNEPFELARSALAGLHGRNPRAGDAACRAVVMVDPFSEPGVPGPCGDASLTTVAGATFRALINQARFTFRDRALIQDEMVYSRYMVAPRRSGIVGSMSLASGGLGAFLGFFSEAYRHHDFMLGRRNAQRFLQTHLTLPEANPLFRSWSEAARRRHRDPRRRDHLQLIPLLGKCAVEERIPVWPAGAFRRDDDLTRAIHTRIDAVLNRIRDDAIRDNVPRPFTAFAPLLAPVVLGLGPLIARRKLKEKAVESIDDAVRAIDRAP
ncbi:MAG TPA: patatin-like phospholipase family protein [Geminicoccaceae bacterium]